MTFLSGELSVVEKAITYVVVSKNRSIRNVFYLCWMDFQCFGRWKWEHVSSLLALGLSRVLCCWNEIRWYYEMERTLGQ